MKLLPSGSGMANIEDEDLPDPDHGRPAELAGLTLAELEEMADLIAGNRIGWPPASPMAEVRPPGS
jgi:hypothetical protein